MKMQPHLIPIADLYADLPLDVIFRRKNYLKPNDPGFDHSSVVEQRHLQKLRAGGISGLDAIICVEPEYKPHDALSRSLEMLDASVEDLKFTENFVLVTQGSEFSRLI